MNPHVSAEVQRILDGAARRLLADELNGDAVPSPAGNDNGSCDGGADERSLLAKRQPVPIVAHPDRQRRAKAA